MDGTPPDKDDTFAKPGKYAAPLIKDGGEIPEEEAWGVTGVSAA